LLHTRIIKDNNNSTS